RQRAARSTPLEAIAALAAAVPAPFAAEHVGLGVAHHPPGAAREEHLGHLLAERARRGDAIRALAEADLGGGAEAAPPVDAADEALEEEAPAVLGEGGVPGAGRAAAPFEQAEELPLGVHAHAGALALERREERAEIVAV